MYRHTVFSMTKIGSDHELKTSSDGDPDEAATSEVESDPALIRIYYSLL